MEAELLLEQRAWRPAPAAAAAGAPARTRASRAGWRRPRARPGRGARGALLEERHHAQRGRKLLLAEPLALRGEQRLHLVPDLARRPTTSQRSDPSARPSPMQPTAGSPVSHPVSKEVYYLDRHLQRSIDQKRVAVHGRQPMSAGRRSCASLSLSSRPRLAAPSG